MLLQCFTCASYLLTPSRSQLYSRARFTNTPSFLTSFCLSARVAKPTPMSLGTAHACTNNTSSSAAEESTTTGFDEVLVMAVAIPPPPKAAKLRSRVEHFIAPRQALISVLVAEALQVSREEFVLPLIKFGAIFTCPVPPLPPEGRGKVRSEALQKAREASLLKHGKHGSKSVPRRISEDVVIDENEYVRVHMLPKRFPLFYQVNWKDRIIADYNDFVIVDKPGGVPCVPTVDNLLECVPTGAAAAIGAPFLLPTHRLDHATEGVLVLGKSQAFVSRFNFMIREGISLRKWYRCITTSPAPLGPLIHRLVTNQRSVGLPSHSIALEASDPESEIHGAVHAELVVLHSRPVTLTGEAAAMWGTEAWETELELITGRTHQIRAQLSAMGCPLLGDDLYIPLTDKEMRLASLRGDLSPASALHDRILTEPTGRIGLQSCRLQIDAPDMAPPGQEVALFEAGAPWWRQQAS